MAKMRGEKQRRALFCHIFLSFQVTQKLKTQSDLILNVDSNHVYFGIDIQKFKKKENANLKKVGNFYFLKHNSVS